MTPIIVDTEVGISQMLDSLVKQTTSAPISPRPFLFVDLEGVNLSRFGIISILQILVPTTSTVYLVDIQILKDAAFKSANTGAPTLKEVLEPDGWAKFFFDVRNDSDALFSHFGIKLSGVVDIQVMEFACRNGRRQFVHGLAKCVESDLLLSFADLRQWREVKEAGKKLFAGDKGESFGAFLERPLPAKLVDYCVQDVLIMPKLLMLYSRRFVGNESLAQSVLTESSNRISASQSPTFNGKGRHMAIGPVLKSRKVDSVPFPMNVICAGEADGICTVVEMDNGRAAETGIAEDEEAFVGGNTHRGARLRETHTPFSYGMEAPDMDRDEYDDTMKDLTACDKECGYCGGCDY